MSPQVRPATQWEEVVDERNIGMFVDVLESFFAEYFESIIICLQTMLKIKKKEILFPILHACAF